MNLKKFIEKYTTAPIKEKKVAEIVKAYGAELPEEVQHFVSACGNEPLFLEDDKTNADFRVLSFDEIVDAEEDMDTDFKSMKMIPLIDCYDNQFVVYKFEEQCWAMYSFDDDNSWDENPSLGDFLLNIYDFKIIFERNLAKAENGDADAMYELGECFYYGEGVRTSNKKAAAWFEKAAELGNIKAMKRIANWYSSGTGVPKSDVKAAAWFERAFENADAESQFDLGYRFYTGDGVPKNLSKAAEWFEKAAEKGHAVGQRNLGSCYLEGYGVKQDKQKAAEWFRKSAEQGHAEAQNDLGWCYDKGYGVPQSDVKAVEWYRKAAEQGHGVAQYNIGLNYYNGTGVEQNYEIAKEWFEKSAAQGNKDGQFYLAVLYYAGEGVEQDYKKALDLWLLSAKQGDGNAMYNIGILYLKGHGVEKNEATAVEWIKKATSQGCVTAFSTLGECYEEGCGVEKDMELAVSWYRKAADSGDQDAVNALARLGKTGNAEDVPVNETPAQNEEVEKLPSVCFTGACPGYTRAELSDLVEGKYVVKDSVTKDLDILVCADPNSGSSKLQKAAKNGVRIMSYDDFLAIIGEDDEEGDEQRQIELTKKVLDDIRKNTMKPLLRLKLTKKPVSLFESKVGGLPYLPNKEAVPFDANGCPLRMVAQIDCKELSYLPDYPQTGLMQFWVGQDEVYGLDIDGGARVVWYETIDETVTDDMVRAWLDELPQPEDDEDFPIQDEFAISFSETQEPMSLLDNNFTDIFTEKYNELSDDEPIDDYDELSEEAHSLIEDFADSDGHKIGGYPVFCQDDPRNENQTVVLLQIDSDSDNDIWWGDSGVCGFFCTPEELKKRDFSNVLYNWDCY
ncbi:MAG: SEL1-like repeat protein [Paludibacteraceae bacterium]|nr:SEL1-like repeat protein [Paludibacteraceae bacterium]